ncbi:MAG TPA: hypothetical protein VGO47_11930 [Chlamydiales bacterium]|nr:hypothetical protein [Chlamydiales bacterium]
MSDWVGRAQAIPVSPYLSDGIGRKRALLFGSVIIVGGTVLQMLAKNLTHFIAARGMSKFDSTFALLGPPTEFSTHSWPWPMFCDQCRAAVDYRVGISNTGPSYY